MLLVACVGNTSVRLGLFDNVRLCQTWKFPVKELQSRSLTHGGPDIQWKNLLTGVVASGVNPPAEKLLNDCITDQIGLEPAWVGRDVHVPLANMCEPPESVGNDRLLNAYAAHSMFKKNAVVADFGTAISFSVISGDGVFLGGAIAPGLHMSARALASQTALLPEVKPEPVSSSCGRSTEEAIRIGLAQGLAGLADRIYDTLAQSFSEPPLLIGTGGDLDWFLSLCDCNIMPYPHLVLEGLRLLGTSCLNF